MSIQISTIADQTNSMGNLSDSSRNAIVQELLVLSADRVLLRGALAKVAVMFKYDRATVARTWHRYTESIARGVDGGNCTAKLEDTVGRKPYDMLKRFGPSRWLTGPTFGVLPPEAVGASRSLVHRLLAEGALKRSTGKIKPTLTLENKLARLQHALLFLNDETLQFDPFFYYVHVDEKWFYEDRNERSCILVDGEEAPHGARKSKRFILKTMFLAAVVRPRYELAHFIVLIVYIF